MSTGPASTHDQLDEPAVDGQLPQSVTTVDSPPDEAAHDAGGSRPWRRSVTVATITWITSHVAYIIVTLLSWRVGRLSPPKPSHILGTWQRWDTGNFLRIAEVGYGHVPLDSAFFPLYPMLIRAFDLVLPGHGLISALAVSNLALFGALVVLHRLTSFEFGDAVAERTLIYLIAFPTAFFLTAAYNHSLFILLAVGSLYAMRRGHWWVAGLLAGLSTATRSTGMFLAFPFAYEYLRQRGFRPRAIRADVCAIALVPSGLAAYALYLWHRVGDPLAFSHAQHYWYRHFTWPWVSLWRAFRQAWMAPMLSEFAVVNTIDLLAALFCLGVTALCVVGPWKLRRDQLYLFVFGLGVALFPLLFATNDNRPIISTARLVIEAVPMFMMLGRVGRNRLFDRLYPMPAIALQVLLLAIFLHYDWAG